MTKKVKLFEDYYNGPDRIKSKFAGEEMLNDLAIKQAELEEKIDFVMENGGAYFKVIQEFPDGNLRQVITEKLKELYEEQKNPTNKDK